MAFAGGVTLKDTMGWSRRTVRNAVVLGLVTSSLCYSLAAWAVPVFHHRDLVARGVETEDTRQFGPRTPAGILRNLRFVEAYPPAEHSLRADTPELYPPNVLRWQLHLPLAVAAFGLANVFLGVISAELTVDLRRGRRRNALLAIGIAGAAAFLWLQLVTAPIEPFLGSGEFRSGILAAWLPLSVPIAECLVLMYFVRSRRFG